MLLQRPPFPTLFPYTTLFRSPWGDSDRTRVGDWVVAIGNPFGLGGSVTTGILSARSRDIQQGPYDRSEEHTSELQSRREIVCRLLLEKKKHTQVSALPEL